MRISDWSSDVCSSDLRDAALVVGYRIVDIGPVGARLAVLDHLVAAVAPGGTLAIVSVDPGAWYHTADPVTRDPGTPGPPHPDTWAHLLHERGPARSEERRGGEDLVSTCRSGCGPVHTTKK